MKYREVHQKKVDYIEHLIDDGHITFIVNFTDGKQFSVSYALHAVLENAELTDFSSGNGTLLKTYYRRRMSRRNGKKV